MKTFKLKKGLTAQSVVNLTAEPGLQVQPGSHTFVEIDHEIISTVFLLPPLIRDGLSVTSKTIFAQSTG